MSFKTNFTYRNANDKDCSDRQYFFFNSFENISSIYGPSFIDRQIRDLTAELKYSSQTIKFHKIFNISETEHLTVCINAQKINIPFRGNFYRTEDIDLLLNNDKLKNYFDIKFEKTSKILDKGFLTVIAKQPNISFQITPKLACMLGFIEFKNYRKKSEIVLIEFEQNKPRKFNFDLIFPISEIKLHCNIFMNNADFLLLTKNLIQGELLEICTNDSIKVLSLSMPKMRIVNGGNVKCSNIYFLDAFAKPIYFSWSDIQFVVGH